MFRKLFVLLFCSALSMFAQGRGAFTTDLLVTVRTLDFKGSVSRLEQFIKNSKAVVQSRNDNKQMVNIVLIFTETNISDVENMVQQMGTVVTKKLNTVNNQERLQEINAELTHLKGNKAAYEDLMNKLDSKNEKYTTFWAEARANDEKIFQKERELLLIRGKEAYFTANIIIEDEQTSPGNTDVRFVNMPGVEYAFFRTENPKVGISSKDYSGYFLKYLFTQGKSFALVGAFKSNQSVTDTAQWSEIFIIGFGQDFYSRYLGGGDEQFFNLYSGYELGYAYISNTKTKEDVFYIAPTIGLELFKNKYVLWDSKVHYMLPFSYNKNLRGLSYSMSFNFVF